ncbi:MAG TPA: phosphoribosylformylglycinamidine synthase subunit PurL [Patescibacteria group bacterium]
MATRIEVATTVFDTRSAVRKTKLADFPFAKKIKQLHIIDVYTIDKPFTKQELENIASRLCNPVTQKPFVLTDKNASLPMENTAFDWAIEIGFLPGVTDNVSHTACELIEDLLKVTFSNSENIYTSQITFISGKLTKNEALQIADSLYNPLIQRMHIKSQQEYIKDHGMNIVVPKVTLQDNPKVTEVDLHVSDEELLEIGKKGIKNPDGTTRGPLALDLTFLKTIRDYFDTLGRNPTDIELESIAQTWSEHCKHTIFNDPIDDVQKGLFKSYIRAATEEIRKRKGKNDFCVSVFTDNSGAIAFDDKYLITHKVETHNSPSALDPFGGAITGIVGVNRDALGFGLGAKPVANFYGFCLADPRKDIPLYRSANKQQPMLSAKRIMTGVIEGVNAGGNQSGIPTPQGFISFDDRYRGKPLVFAGTVGLIPRTINGKPSYIKEAQSGDYIVMVGGRVGKDGIHGATFSSEALDSGSPATAVQIGDPITQKKMSDALVKEARDMGLYTSITDDGAGGLSCSVSEMAKESNGCLVELEKVPLKYPGLEPWEIWISESQERMTLSVPKDKWDSFNDLMKRRGVEATIVGEFTNTGRCIVTYKGKTIVDVDMKFLHDGLPVRAMTSKPVTVNYEEPKLAQKTNVTTDFLQMLERLNIASFAFITQQYDHIVQGGLVLPPLQGKGRVNSDVSVFRPVLDSQKAVILAQALYPQYSDINTYHMAAASLDTSIRNAVAAGGNPDYMAILDNFCWCSANEPERLHQLKEAAKACYDYAVAYETPFISGKDSMFNDFKGFDKNGKPIKISIPPTLLISSIGVVDNMTKVVSLDAKNAGDLVYVLGDTFEEMGASEYYAMLSEKTKKQIIGNSIPKVDEKKNSHLYHSVYKAIQNELIESSQSINHGGLAIALAKTLMGGMLGAAISLDQLANTVSRNDFALFSESQGRIVVTVSPKNKKAFEKAMEGNNIYLIGEITKTPKVTIKGINKKIIVSTTVDAMLESYRSTFKGY